MKNNKLSVVMVGHVDHGKSTLIGRLLYDTHSVSEDKIRELEKASMITDNKLEFAFLLDHLREEREQGITIDTTQTFFKSVKREYQIIDAPGHVEFIRNMVTGAAQASSSVLIVDAKEGVMEQTKRHLYILSLLGMKHLIVAVNKMDKVDYKEERFKEVVKQVEEVFEKLHLSTVYFVPISALCGDNICEKSENMPWYKGDIFLDIMDNIETPKEHEDLPFVLPVQDVYKRGDKRIIVGRLETGILHNDDEIKVVQTAQKSSVNSIEKFLENPDCAKAHECIGITLKDSLFLERGKIICDSKAKIELGSEFNASLFWMNNEEIKLNEKLIIRCGTQETTCVIKEIHHKVNTAKLEEIEKDVTQLNNLDAGKVVISTKENLAFSKFINYECIGRFVLLKDGNICAGGIIL